MDKHNQADLIDDARSRLAAMQRRNQIEFLIECALIVAVLLVVAGACCLITLVLSSH